MDRKAAQAKLFQAQAFVEAGKQRLASHRMTIDRRSERGLNILLAAGVIGADGGSTENTCRVSRSAAGPDQRTAGQLISALANSSQPAGGHRRVSTWWALAQPPSRSCGLFCAAIRPSCRQTPRRWHDPSSSPKNFLGEPSSNERSELHARLGVAPETLLRGATGRPSSLRVAIQVERLSIEMSPRAPRSGTGLTPNWRGHRASPSSSSGPAHRGLFLAEQCGAATMQPEERMLRAKKVAIGLETWSVRRKYRSEGATLSGLSTAMKTQLFKNAKRRPTSMWFSTNSAPSTSAPPRRRRRAVRRRPSCPRDGQRRP